ncbi:unnamed protein product [Lactuca saligna]|uniref:Uncharacterized protein n=1 Tax=Lactuca saligna TaxID=75948 RepID=A0AA35VXN2_LACSI|nr:unnamed protein product [Lactuca saligna]
MGKCNLNPLYLIKRDTDLSSIDWCNLIVDCLVRTKKVYNLEKKSSFFYGPAAYLMLYVNSFKFQHLQVTRKHPTILNLTSEKIRFLDDILQENGGFGCGDVNEPYVEEERQESEYNEEESGGDEDLCDEDEENFDVNQVNVVESVGLIDSHEGVSFRQFICDPIVESFLKTLDQGTENLVYVCLHQKRLQYDANENLTVFEKNEFDDSTVNLGEDDKVIVAKKDVQQGSRET